MPLKVDKTKSFCSTENSPKISVNIGNCEIFCGKGIPTIHVLKKLILYYFYILKNTYLYIDFLVEGDTKNPKSNLKK